MRQRRDERFEWLVEFNLRHAVSSSKLLHFHGKRLNMWTSLSAPHVPLVHAAHEGHVFTVKNE